MKYDFVEIGTSNFDTLLQTATDVTRGISIEPIQYYLDALPAPPGVLKLKKAVSPANRFETLEVYYVPETVVHEQGLPDWLRGCNSVGDYHFQHHALNIRHLVQRDHVECVPIGYIFDHYQITELAYLKIDTEGNDCAIMLHLYDYIKDSNLRPGRILFESNELASPAQVQLVIARFVGLGYNLVRSDYDTVLEISST